MYRACSNSRLKVDIFVLPGFYSLSYRHEDDKLFCSSIDELLPVN